MRRPNRLYYLKGVIDRITGEENTYVMLQPENDLTGKYGNGWKGVWKWCHDNASIRKELMNGIEPALDLLVIQMDGDVSRKENPPIAGAKQRNAATRETGIPWSATSPLLGELPVPLLFHARVMMHLWPGICLTSKGFLPHGSKRQMILVSSSHAIVPKPGSSLLMTRPKAWR